MACLIWRIAIGQVLPRCASPKYPTHAVDNFSAALMTERYLALYEKVLDGESLHATEPIIPERSTEGLLPMGR